MAVFVIAFIACNGPKDPPPEGLIQTTDTLIKTDTLKIK